jgi:hypothetical protein
MKNCDIFNIIHIRKTERTLKDIPELGLTFKSFDDLYKFEVWLAEAKQ